ncbi:cell wall metabolism sensor histidine kinase WalK [bacterium]|nr:cell wall metabolism sensor histidine kinase WalK [bacterium]
MLMLLQPSRDLDAPRRVIALHLLSGLSSVALLTFGIVQVVLSLRMEHLDSSAMTMMTKGEALIGADFRHRQGERTASLLDRFNAEYHLQHCAVIGPDGVYIAHSTPALIGSTAMESTGTLNQFGEVEKHTAQTPQGRSLLLYRTPIRQGEEIVATLEAAAWPQEWWTTAISAFRHGLLFILLGVAFLTAGGYFLFCVVRPMSAIEHQLRRAAIEELGQISLESVPATSLPSIGWNKLVDEQVRRVGRQDLESKVAAGLRSHREKRSEAILRSLTDGIALTDHEERITFANPSLQGIVATGEDDVLGRTMDEVIHFAAGSAAALRFNDPLYRSQQVVAEMGKEGDMTKGVLRISRVPLIASSHDASPSHVWMVRDVTQQKLADQMRNQFVYSATHELRTPLANIKAYAETLANMKAIDIEKQKDFCNTINSEATRLSRFIDDLLSISRMETGAMSLQKHETDMMRLFEEVIGKVRPEMDGKGILFNVLIPAKLPRLYVDKDKMTITLVNMLGNAAKYTPEGGHVSFEVEWNEQSIEIHVIDSGIGIAQDEIAKIFDKFFRSNDPRVRDRTGSGLGLSIAHEIVRLHGGKMLVHSELDRGSKFTVILPTA